MFSLPSQTLKTAERSIKKCSFSIESILQPKINSSYIDDTEDGSSNDSHEHLMKIEHPPLLQTKSKSKLNSKSKRLRTIFTSEQLERLEAEFDRQQYMVGNERLRLARKLDLTDTQVKIWFQNRRIKWRRQVLENSHHSTEKTLSSY